MLAGRKKPQHVIGRQHSAYSPYRSQILSAPLAAKYMFEAGLLCSLVLQIVVVLDIRYGEYVSSFRHIS
jgi:hypothetical protein